MASNNRTKKAALFGEMIQDNGNSLPEQAETPISKRNRIVETEDVRTRHQPAQNNSLKIKLDHLKTIEALTPNQQLLIDNYNRGDYFIGILGSPGTGKTYVVLQKALEEVLDKANSFKQVVIVRSAVQTRDQGFLPGSLDEKQEIYEQPYKEICTNLFNRADAYERLKEQGYVRFITTTAIRGISIDDAIIVVDEAQSMTFHELNTVISRTGYKSKIIVIGDGRHQNDLVKSKFDVSGLEEFIKIARTMEDYSEVYFTADDIVRSSLVRSWIIACEEFGY
jgi:phosphate starvation-inducible PhoH-like protein